MVKYESSEASVSLTVYQPNVVIVEYSAPSEYEAGKTFNVTWTVRNDTPDVTVQAFVRLIDLDTGDIVGKIQYEWLSPGETWSGSHSATMPTRKDLRLRLEVGGYSAEVGYVVSDYREFTVVCAVPTEIQDFKASPSTAVPGTEVKVSGKLVRTVDSGLGVGGVTVTIDLSELGLGTVDVTTASDGSFEYTFTCPRVAAGRYTIYARFAGATVAGVAYAPSEAKAGLGVEAVGVPTALWGAVALVGAGLIGYAFWKKL